MSGHTESEGGSDGHEDMRPSVPSKEERKRLERIEREISVGFRCPFCLKLADSNDPFTYREVTSWVHGPKLQSPVLRQQTGRIAHPACIDKLVHGQAPDQDELPGLENND